MSSTEQISRTLAKPRYSTCWRPEPKRADLMIGMSFICNYKRQKSRKHTDKSTRHTEHLLNLFLESICTWGTVLSELLGVPGGPAKTVSEGQWTVCTRTFLPRHPEGGHYAPLRHDTRPLQLTHISLNANPSVFTLLHGQKSREHFCWLSFL